MVKMFKILCLTQMVSAAVFRQRVSPSGVSGVCAEKRLEIETQIAEDKLLSRAAKWRVDMFETPIKQGCKVSIYDLTFCTKVCELSVGEVCTPGIQQPGVDKCGDGLDCVQSENTHTCQPLVDYLFDQPLDYNYPVYNYAQFNSVLSSSNWNSKSDGIELLPGDYDNEISH